MDAPLKLTSPATRGLHYTALAPLIPQLIGSAFNIWYNVSVVLPLLHTAVLQNRFLQTCMVFNLTVYPVGVFIWLRAVYRMWPAFRRLRQGEAVPDEELLDVRRRLIDLPWFGAGLSAIGWGVLIPVFLIVLSVGEVELNRMLLWHLPISILVSAFMAVSHSLSAIELVTHRYLFPVFFARARADLIPGTHTVSLRARGYFWAISGGVCPIVSLLLLSFAPPAPGTNPAAFALFVAVFGIGFCFTSVALFSRLVAKPIQELRLAAQAVAQGRLESEVPVRRADEFGVLAGEFNRMIGELRDKEKLRQTFGLHVGRRAAEQILARDPGLSGVEQIITVMFVDIRSFTKRSADEEPAEIVRVLNQFLEMAVPVVEERHAGMINKYLGDGFMALFGIGEDSAAHADRAVAAGQDLLVELGPLNERLVGEGVEPLAIGIGLHTGPAIVGSIGSPQRLEFTVIGATVNLASRIEGLTKTLGSPLVFTDATRQAFCTPIPVRTLEPQAVRGVEAPVAVFAPGGK